MPLLEAGLLGALALARLLVARERGGISLADMAFIALLSGSLVRRLLAARGRLPGMPRLVFLVELTAFAGVLAQPLGLVSFGLLVAAALALVLAPGDDGAGEAKATVSEELLVIAVPLGGGALTLLVNRWIGDHPGVLVALLALLVEAYGPWAPRTLGAAARRAAAFGVAMAATLSAGHDDRSGLAADEALAGAAVALGFAAAVAVVARCFSRRAIDDPRDAIDAVVAAGEGRGAWLAHTTSLAVLGAALLGAGVLRLPVDRTLDPRGERGGDEATVSVLEDGVALGPPHAHAATIRAGQGAHACDGGHVMFSSSDGTDPRGNGRRYVLRYEWLPSASVATLLVLAGALLNARRAGRALARVEAANPAWIAGALLLLALAFRALVPLREPELTFGGHLVKGSLFSDARDWYTTSVEFSENVRWNRCWAWCDARRPFHYVFYGSFFSLVGPSVLAARVLNVVLSALATVFIFDAVRRLSTRFAAIVAALAHAVLLYDARNDLSVMTEPLGAFLAAVSLWAFAVGAADLVAGRARSAYLGLGGAGLALALSNLARPLTLPAIAFMPLALALVARRAGTPWRRVGAGAGLLVLGFTIALGPWLVRQRLVHGIWTLSENTAEMLYGATSPEHGGWSGDVGALASETRSVKERVDFFMAGARRNLREHPGWYARHVIEQLALGARRTAPEGWTVLAVAAACLATALVGFAERRRSATAGVLGAAIVAVAAPLVPLHVVATAAIAWTVLRRTHLVLLASLHVPTLVAIAMVSESSDRRFTHALEWCAATFAVDLVGRALAALAGRPAARTDEASWGRAGGAARVAALVAIALLVAGAVRSLTRTPGPPPPSFELSEGRVTARRVRIRPGFVMHFAPGETIEHWCPLFARRPYERTIIETVPESPEIHAVLPGPPPLLGPDDALLLLGTSVARASYGSSFETIAYGVVRAGETAPREIVHAGAPASRRRP